VVILDMGPSLTIFRLASSNRFIFVFCWSCVRSSLKRE